MSLQAFAQEFPYICDVKTNGSTVRSGPGRSHYGTQELGIGRQVKVFRHDPGGWVAIQPPAGSFSLIQLADVNWDGKGSATVKNNDAKAWVGTRLAPVENPLWQIRLRQGEILEVYGEVDRERLRLDDAQPTWLQIAPPNGEFRWIHGSQLNLRVVTSPNASQLPSTQHGNTPGTASPPLVRPQPTTQQHPVQKPGEPQRSKTDSLDWTLEVEESTPSSTSPSINQGWVPATRKINATPQLQSEFVSTDISTQRNTASPEADAWNRNLSVPTRLVSTPDVTTTNQFPNSPTNQENLWNQPSATSTQLIPPLLQLEQQLTREMLKQPADWDLQNLAAQVQQYRARTTDGREIQQIDNLLKKIQNCQVIQAGFRATGVPAGTTGQQPYTTPYPNGQADRVAVSDKNIRLVGGESELAGTYDAFGWLNELVRDGGLGKPTFVLQNSEGKITHHIDAPPGLNLRRYLNQKVGIIGNRGFHQDLKLDHVTAERVIAIKSLR